MKHIQIFESTKQSKSKIEVVYNILEKIIEEKSMVKFKIVMKKMSKDLDISYKGNELLFLAIENSFYEIIPFLIKRITKPKVNNYKIELYKLLKENRPLFNKVISKYKFKDSTIKSLIHQMCQNDDLKLFKNLLKYQNVEVDNVLFNFIIRQNAVKLFKYLYKNHQNDFDPSNGGNYPYKYVTQHNYDTDAYIINKLRLDKRVDKDSDFRKMDSWYQSYFKQLDYGEREKRKIDNNTWVEMMYNNNIAVLFHWTYVAVVSPNGKWRFNTAGHRTNTTKSRISEYSIASIVQKSGEWFIDFYGGDDKYIFEDDMTYYKGVVRNKEGKKLKPITK